MKALLCCTLLLAIPHFVAAQPADKDNDKTDEAKPKVMASAMLLIGKWHLDRKVLLEVIKKRLAKPKIDAAIRDDLRLLHDVIEVSPHEMRIEFNAAGKTSFNVPIEKEKEGTWRIENLESDTVTVVTSIHDEALKIVFVDRDTIDLYTPQSQIVIKLRFTRAKK